MAEKILILQTKITPPDIKEHILRRPLLMKKMKAVTVYPVTIINSGPGYGKTTVIASYIKDDKKTSYCWYSVSSSDDDILPFLSYITHCVRKHHPNFGLDLLAYITDIDRYVRSEELRTLCTIFINEIMNLKTAITLIIDDYHLVKHSPSVDEWMERLLQHLPSNLHIVILSRSRPTWDIITQLKVKGSLFELSQNDLLFSFEETEVLLSDIYGNHLEKEEIKKIFEMTEGWIIAIGMILQQLATSGNVTEIVENKSQSLDELFRFLAMEVFMKQPPMVQQFLENTCVFEELTGAVCDYVLGIKGSSEMLEELSNKNLFLITNGKGQYRYHALFREFLEGQLRSSNEMQYRNLHSLSATYFLRVDDYINALMHLDKIADYRRIAEILHHHGQLMIVSGQLESLLDKLRKIPPEIKNHYYLLWYYHGEVLRYRCSYSEAEQCYLIAAKKAVEANDNHGESKALEGQAEIYLDTIQPAKAERILQKSIAVLEKSKDSSPIDKGRLYRLMAENLANLGKAEKAKKWYLRGKEIDSGLADGNLEARLYLRTGRLFEAKKILISQKQKNPANETGHLQQSHRETDLLLSLIESFMGNGMEAKGLADAGIKQGIRFQAPFVEACGWMRMGHAVQLIDKYDMSLARQCYETALELMDNMSVARGRAEPLMGLCILHGNKGLFDRAIEYGNRALEETENVKDAWLSALILLCMGIASVHNQQWDKAEEYLQRCNVLFTDCGDQFGALMTELWNSFLSFYIGDLDRFSTSIGNFIKMLQVGGYEFILRKKTTFGPSDSSNIAPLLLEAQKLGIQSQYVNQLISELGFSNITSHPGYTLRIQTLGQFNVWLGNTLIAESDWQRVKAKELLELFVTKRHALIPKEEIFEILWPDHDEKAAARDFKVALNALNNALEPSRKARATPFFIVREGTAYGINPNSGYLLDSAEFEEWIQTGLQEREKERVIECLERGLEFYQGDFLPDRRYDDWCLNERERLQVYFLRGAERLAQAFVQCKLYDQAIEWCEQIIMKDKTWEEAYRLIMFCYYQKNNRPQAMKWYKKCCKALEDELGVKPMEPTIQMYEMIMGPMMR